jgi:hypothetical protein
MKYETEHFDSITALHAHLAKTIGQPFPFGDSSLSNREAHSWDLDTGFNKAMNMARCGGYWPNGAADLQSVDITEAAQTMAREIVPVIVNDVVGGAIDVDEYLNGNGPECFLRMEDEPDHIRPVVRVGVCIVASSSVKASVMMHRGRAILAMVDALELRGYSVELTAMHQVSRDDLIYLCCTVLKHAGAHWDPSSVAFGLAHPAFARRLGFRALEFNPAVTHFTKGGYGSVRNQKPAGYDMYFNGLTDNGADTPEKALAKVTDDMNHQAPHLMA